MNTLTLSHFPAAPGPNGWLWKCLAGCRHALTRSAAVFVILMLSACSDIVNLQTGLNDADANEIVTLLHRYGIEAQKEPMKEGITVKVKSTDIARATEAMQQAGLPRRKLADLGRVFKKEGMISTPMEERVRYIHGLSQELEYTLQQIDNVVAARVHVVLPERVAPGEPILPSSAAVFIKHHLPFDEDAMLPRIRNLVASSIPGLSREQDLDKVSVVLTPAADTMPSIEWTSVGPFKVQQESAGSLRATLVALIMLIFTYLGMGLWNFLMRFPKIAGMVRQAVNKVKALVKKVTHILTPATQA